MKFSALNHPMKYSFVKFAERLDKESTEYIDDEVELNLSKVKSIHYEDLLK